jgi:hypothetical protein
MPMPAPAAESITLSVNNCRTSRAGDAPIAVRIESSRRRATLRESSMFATLAQATSRTSSTAPCSTSSIWRLFDERKSCSRYSRTSRCRLFCRLNDLLTAFRSSAAR